VLDGAGATVVPAGQTVTLSADANKGSIADKIGADTTTTAPGTVSVIINPNGDTGGTETEVPISNPTSPSSPSSPSYDIVITPPPATPVATPTATPTVTTLDSLIDQAESIAAGYEAQLETLKTDIESEWSNSDKTNAAKQALIATYLDKALALESESDIEVGEIIEKIAALDSAKAAEAEQEYETNKAAKIAAYEAELTQAVLDIYESLKP
jgi:hypothetical protein